jgi:hypothetical protein
MTDLIEGRTLLTTKTTSMIAGSLVVPAGAGRIKAAACRTRRESY